MIPTAEQLAEMDKHKLPCDVFCGPIVFGKGVSLGVFVRAATHWREIAATYEIISAGPPNLSERAEELRRLADILDAWSSSGEKVI
jgi:hypothetical protein